MVIQWPFFQPTYMASIISHLPYFRLHYIHIFVWIQILENHWWGIWTWWSQEILGFFHPFTWSLCVTGWIRLPVPKRELSECPTSSFCILLCWVQASRGCFKLSGFASYTCLFPESVPSFTEIFPLFCLLPVCSIKILLFVSHHRKTYYGVV